MANDLQNLGAIVAEEVAKSYKIITIAIRTEPVDPQDSGWQFLSINSDMAKISGAEIWTIQEVLDADPSISKILQSPYGSYFKRYNANCAWIRTEYVIE